MVSHDRDNLVTFVIRLCSIISGIIVISGAVNALLVAIQRRLLRMFAPQLYLRLPGATSPPPAPPAPVSSVPMPANDLLNTANLMANVDISAYLPTAMAANKSDI